MPPCYRPGVTWSGRAMAIMLSLAMCACGTEDEEPAGVHHVAEAAARFDAQPDAVLETEDGFLTLRRTGDQVELLYLARGGDRVQAIADWTDVEEASLTHVQIVVCGPGVLVRRPIFIAGRWEGRESVRLTGGQALGGRLGEDHFLFALDAQGVPDGAWHILVPDSFAGGETDIVEGHSPLSFERARDSVPAINACAVG